MDINQVFLIGRLTRDVELRYTQNSIACATIDLAINNGRDKNGNERKADFVNVVIWEKQAENVSKYCHKGSKIAVVGSIKTDSYEKNGEKRYKTYVLANRVQFLDNIKNQETSKEEQIDPFEEMGKQVEMEFTADDLPF